MTSGPITSRQIEWGKSETGTDFLSSGSKITVNGNCSSEIKRCLLLRRKVLTNLDGVLKSKVITLLAKVCINQSYGFSSRHVQV